MIITVTASPAVDQTIFVRTLAVGDINRFEDSQLDPAGKGINASRMAHRLGWPTIAFGFLAGEVGAIAERALDLEGVQHHFVRVPGQTRLNVTVFDRGRRSATSFYGPGPAVDGEHLARLDEILRFWIPAARVLVLGGSLPAGVPDDLYARLVRVAAIAGVLTVVDADGAPLRRAIEAGPSLIKPNRRELETLLGRPLKDHGAVIRGAREVAARGISVVVVSLGVEGAICVHGDTAWRAVPPEIELRSTVGSGDSMVAGLAVALARGDDLVSGLRLGTAAGAATAMTPGTALGTAGEVASLLPQVRIEELT